MEPFRHESSLKVHLLRQANPSSPLIFVGSLSKKVANTSEQVCYCMYKYD